MLLDPDYIGKTVSENAADGYEKTGLNELIAVVKVLMKQGKVTDKVLFDLVDECPYALDVDLMKKASEYLIGRHDFTSFNATSLTEKPDQIRTVKDISFSMTYIECDTPDERNEKALEVLKEDHFGIVLCYNANFDSTMHRYGPEAEVSLAQIDHNAKAFQTLVEAAKKTWKGKMPYLHFCRIMAVMR